MKVVIINKRTKEEKVLESGLTEKEAESFCEAWGWYYTDETGKTFWLAIEED